GEDKVVFDTLVHTFQHDGDTSVRTAAVSALAILFPQSSEVVDLLCDAVRHDRNTTVRIQVADNLRRMGKEAGAALSALIAALLEDRNVTVRYSAVSAVAEIATEESQLERLLDALQQNPNELVRQAIAKTLGQIKFRSERVADSLVQALN